MGTAYLVGLAASHAMKLDTALIVLTICTLTLDPAPIVLFLVINAIRLDA